MTAADTAPELVDVVARAIRQEIERQSDESGLYCADYGDDGDVTLEAVNVPGLSRAALAAIDLAADTAPELPLSREAITDIEWDAAGPIWGLAQTQMLAAHDWRDRAADLAAKLAAAQGALRMARIYVTEPVCLAIINNALPQQPSKLSVEGSSPSGRTTMTALWPSASNLPAVKPEGE